jgi:hypothetical protein
MARKVVYERSGEPAQVVRVVESDEPRAPERPGSRSGSGVLGPPR